LSLCDIMKIRKRNVFRIIWFSLVTIFFIWQWSTYQSRALPENTFIDNESVTVAESSDKITFNPGIARNKSEIIFFQGGLTDPKAYAPLCRKIAENGFACHLIKMDWRLPQYDYQKITHLFNLKKGNYILGGHSQGAKMASQFIYENPKLMKGLFLLGTSHPRDFDLSGHTVPTIKLYGENDGLASVAEVMGNKAKLPQKSTLTLIAGGNHAQFGYLGKLLTDDAAEISLKEQQRLTLEALIKHFDNIEQEL
jgi:pimeloyl-ACP methyl ester carboxylesterase